ncbi:MAG TPA: hypothetical protein VH062_34135 [Polyangiaceae bacterium]|jgi:hypothetical protein|nr:hypothetical protein [Polyangiaceae bacterium]
MQIRTSSSFVALATLLLGACTSSGSGGSSDAGLDANPDATGPSTGGSTGAGGSGGRGGSAATGGSAGRAGSTGTGGSTGTLDGGSPSSDSGTPDGGGSCSVSGTDLTTDATHQLSGLSFGGDRLAFLSSDLTLTDAPTIDTVHTNGTGRTTIYTPTGERRVNALITHGTTVYFLELNDDPSPMQELFSLPVAGGTATRLGAATFNAARFVGADDTSLYLVWDTDQPVGAVFARIVETTGAKATAATLENVATPFYPQLSGDSIYFVDSTIGDPITTNTYGFPKAGADVTPTLLWTSNDTTDTCYLGIGGLTATPTKLVCGLFGVESHARTGGTGAVVVPKDLTMRANEVVASDAENVYLNTPPMDSTSVGTLQRVASTGGAITPIACDVRELENHMADGVFPIQNEFEVIVGGDQLYWIEKNVSTADTTWTIRSAAK